MDHTRRIIDFALTDKCNIRCPFCCAYGSPKNECFISADKIIECLKETVQEGQFTIVRFLGGEPLIHPQLEEIISKVWEFNSQIYINITTNGLLLKEWINKLIELKDKYKAHLSIRLSMNYYVCSRTPTYWEEIEQAVKIGKESKIGFTINFLKRFSNLDEPEITQHLANSEALSKITCRLGVIRAIGRGKTDLVNYRPEKKMICKFNCEHIFFTVEGLKVNSCDEQTEKHLEFLKDAD